MKYVRMFENFDKYDFKKIVGFGHDLMGEYDEIRYNLCESITTEDFFIIGKSVSRCGVKTWSTGKGHAFIRISDFSDNVTYEIYFMGDYCYCMVEHRRSMVASIESFDGFDALVDVIESKEL